MVKMKLGEIRSATNNYFHDRLSFRLLSKIITFIDQLQSCHFLFYKIKSDKEKQQIHAFEKLELEFDIFA